MCRMKWRVEKWKRNKADEENKATTFNASANSCISIAKNSLHQTHGLFIHIGATLHRESAQVRERRQEAERKKEK